MMLPARLAQAGAPFLFDLALSSHGAAALVLTAGLGVVSFAVLTALRLSVRRAV